MPAWSAETPHVALISDDQISNRAGFRSGLEGSKCLHQDTALQLAMKCQLIFARTLCPRPWLECQDFPAFFDEIGQGLAHVFHFDSQLAELFRDPIGIRAGEASLHLDSVLRHHRQLCL